MATDARTEVQKHIAALEAILTLLGASSYWFNDEQGYCAQIGRYEYTGLRIKNRSITPQLIAEGGFVSVNLLLECTSCTDTRV